MSTLGVKALAKRNNINLASITGTGKGGRVTKHDVLEAVDRLPTSGKVRSTPAVRAFAKKNNVDINQISGTGPDSRVTKDDVVAFMSKGTKPAPAKQSVMSTGASISGVIGVP